MSKLFRKGITLILALLMVFCTPVQVFAKTDDSDKSSSASQIAIQYLNDLKLADSSIFTDYSKNITREEFSMLCVRLYEAALDQSVKAGSKNPFSDISKSPYKKEILKAYKLMIVSKSTKFNPKAELTRQEISVMIYNTFKAIHPEWNYTTKEKYAFEDSKDIAKSAKQAVVYLYRNYIMRGPSELVISPKSKVTREEALTLDFRAAFFSGVLFKLTESGDKDKEVVKDGDDGTIESLTTDDASDYFELGNKYFDDGFNNKAVSAYTKAIELDPTFHKAYRERANAYYWKRKYDEALIDAQKALELAPYDGWCYAQVGGAYRKLGKTDDAVINLTKGIELLKNSEPDNTDYSWIYVYRAQCYMEKGLLSEAINDFVAAARMGDSGSKDILDILNIKY
jgi:tetratricopeptide (TPR) repeat protein